MKCPAACFHGMLGYTRDAKGRPNRPIPCATCGGKGTLQPKERA